jgi:hypothetical protein
MQSTDRLLGPVKAFVDLFTANYPDDWEDNAFVHIGIVRYVAGMIP